MAQGIHKPEEKVDDEEEEDEEGERFLTNWTITTLQSLFPDADCWLTLAKRILRLVKPGSTLSKYSPAEVAQTNIHQYAGMMLSNGSKCYAGKFHGRDRLDFVTFATRKREHNYGRIFALVQFKLQQTEIYEFAIVQKLATTDVEEEDRVNENYTKMGTLKNEYHVLHLSDVTALISARTNWKVGSDSYWLSKLL